jgi:hypothetical protein
MTRLRNATYRDRGTLGHIGSTEHRHARVNTGYSQQPDGLAGQPFRGRQVKHPVRLRLSRTLYTSSPVLLLMALLRCAGPGQTEVASSTRDQIAKTSSLNATASRLLVGSSTASS